MRFFPKRGPICDTQAGLTPKVMFETPHMRVFLAYCARLCFVFLAPRPNPGAHTLSHQSICVPDMVTDDAKPQTPRRCLWRWYTSLDTGWTGRSGQRPQHRQAKSGIHRCTHYRASLPTCGCSGASGGDPGGLSIFDIPIVSHLRQSKQPHHEGDPPVTGCAPDSDLLTLTPLHPFDPTLPQFASVAAAPSAHACASLSPAACPVLGGSQGVQAVPQQQNLPQRCGDGPQCCTGGSCCGVCNVGPPLEEQ